MRDGKAYPSSAPAATPRLSVPSERPAKVRAWSAADLGVVVAALLLLGLSIVGLFWLLHT